MTRARPFSSGCPSRLPSPRLLFNDVAAGAWYYGAVKYVYDHEIMAGTGDTTFGPEENLDRAQVVQILYNLEGTPDISEEDLGYPYEDVDADIWYTNAVYWARLTGVAEGDGTEPSAPRMTLPARSWPRCSTTMRSIRSMT